MTFPCPLPISFLSFCAKGHGQPMVRLCPAKQTTTLDESIGVNLPAKCCGFQMSSEPRWKPCGQTENASFY